MNSPPRTTSLRFLLLIAFCSIHISIALEHSAQAQYGGIRPQDEILLVSTRAAGCTTDPERLASALKVSSYSMVDQSGAFRWINVDPSQFFVPSDPSVPTIVFVHGNQVSSYDAQRQGLAVYRALTDSARDDRPIRLVTWSWASDKVGGIIRDAQVKAARTGPVGWQLAWALDQLPAEAPVGLLGYSFGARVTSGAAHLLAGGSLGAIHLQPRRSTQRPPINAIFLAPALDAHWLGPNQYHGLAMSQIDRLLIVVNPRDPAMRFYHFTSSCSNPQALGYCGPIGNLGHSAGRVRCLNASGYAGAKHDLLRYIASRRVMGEAWEYLTYAGGDGSLAGLPGDLPIAVRAAGRTGAP